MLRFEREVVGSLIGTGDPAVRASVEAFVDGSLRDMPEHLRAGVLGESILLAAYVAALRRTGRLATDDPAALRRQVEAWESSPIGVLRSWVRMMTSLVVFAENELAGPTPTGTAGATGSTA
jgi:hypothetical protein